ncbi:hypothetical protein RND81_01G160000 [Saponaria officinalis]|uniref:PI4-kinase N-terminal domain-containing protein n=1 Tax=Saponaria officinalis TaxID=3572 RepID=A0AAW1NJ44_SAPOF
MWSIHLLFACKKFHYARLSVNLSINQVEFFVFSFNLIASLGGNLTEIVDSCGIARHHVSNFEEDDAESLERQEIAFKLLWHILDGKVDLDTKVLEQLRLVAKRHLQSSPAFLKIRKRDWTENGQLLKGRVSMKLSVFKAAARLMIKSLT